MPLRPLPWKHLAWALSAVIVALVAYLAIGSVTIPLPVILMNLALGNTGGSGDNLILWQIRMPRACACVCVGAILGSAGAVFQALFRNPLAEPTLIGVSSGAAVGGTFAILVGLDAGLGRVGFAALGALGSLGLVMALARRQGSINVQTLLVSGVVIGTMLSGLTTLNLTLAGLNVNILWWLLGSATPMFWNRVELLFVTGLVGSGLLLLQSRKLNALTLGEFMAERQGVDVKRLKWIVLGAGTAMTGVAVGTVGIVGFVGLIGPHLARRVVGNDLRASLPLSCLLGSLILLVSDNLAQRLIPGGGEVPLGAVTAVLGAPVLLWMLRRKG